jgi:hypothetical protein
LAASGGAGGVLQTIKRKRNPSRQALLAFDSVFKRTRYWIEKRKALKLLARHFLDGSFDLFGDGRLPGWGRDCPRST